MHTKLTERILRSKLPGNQHIAERKEFRQLCQNGDVKQLTEIARFDDGQLAQTARALIEELERVAKDRARTLATNAEVTKAQAEGCPCCGRKIKRNNSLNGWWQCSQFGAVGFRAEANQPACNWQAFFIEGVS